MSVFLLFRDLCIQVELQWFWLSCFWAEGLKFPYMFCAFVTWISFQATDEAKQVICNYINCTGIIQNNSIGMIYIWMFSFTNIFLEFAY